MLLDQDGAMSEDGMLMLCQSAWPPSKEATGKGRSKEMPKILRVRVPQDEKEERWVRKSA